MTPASPRVPVRVVVVGFGMVGARLVDELERRDPWGLDVTVLGAEEYEPYNRVLLSDVVAGRTDLAAIGLPLPGGRARVERGVDAVGIDRGARVVLASDGSRHPYDLLVLATGARARIPAIPGLDGAALPAGVHPLRTLDDAREIVAATLNAPRAVVVGGGVLGVEAALGLAARGLQVALVHPGATIMDRQLDPGAGQVLEDQLAAHDVRVLTGSRPAEVLVVAGRTVGLRLDRTPAAGSTSAAPSTSTARSASAARSVPSLGTGALASRRADLDGSEGPMGDVVAAGLVVVAAGAVPETRLAAGAGLTVDRGIVVGHDLASVDDPAVFAIGDCAQPPEGSRGLVAEGWDQARRLAQAIADAAQRATPPAPAGSGPGPDGRSTDQRTTDARSTGQRTSDQHPAGPRVHLRGPWEGDRPSLALRLGTPLATRAATDRGVEVRGTDVVKVKAGHLSVVAMGACGADRTPRPGERAVRLADPAGGRWVEAVVADGLLVGATCVGDARVAADLTAAYTRRTPVPADPAFLLLTPVAPTAAPATSPEHMPDDAVVCRCNGVSKADVAAAVEGGARDVADVAAATRATTGCGGCADAVGGLCGWLAGLRAAAAEVVPDAV
ncbi:BFD domain protein (2Fe-2S)-binding domain protein [Xylanimonas cellulosilytica DSM 15894]|uniref:BFD domain protein (2Fe-2S)-binding domain protein n=1 Tax=Xylanimonas cellulosilytica (strain DSM 15894 / JCM 12276 / CECT 5975 / KCTC 9989 / LMG 20990 / NBRC 107835 / XIL07) TaxID=446471 RepID=D1BSZ8_XYLCX|nr:FAD-dependent oxidoreductase [Xylanimonas cellulosilytica]ACZ30840.1 BFD domain protein (2Fe-2S)-binding domain protein [Xylanimonas cellulosilytica DSM 15894]